MFCGVDITEVDRIKIAVERTGQPFLNRIYTEAEQAYCESRRSHRYESYAGRFAAKEAVSKAMGTGFRDKVAFSMIEILNDDLGKPYCILHGSTAEYFEEHFTGMTISVSISHTKDSAVAFAVIG